MVAASNKSSLRREARARLQSLTAGERLQKSQAISQHLSQHLSNQPAGARWGSYCAFKSEVNLRNLPNHVQWVFPRITGDSLEFFNTQDGWETHPLGFEQPSNSNTSLKMDELDGVLVPGLGFSPAGVRLGRGKGHYDRALKSFRGECIGVAYGCQIFLNLPADSWDVEMTAIVTEDGWLKVNQTQDRERN